MKTIVIIHNLNSRGKNINEDYVRELLNKKGIKFHYFQTKQISDVDPIIKNTTIHQNFNTVLLAVMVH